MAKKLINTLILAFSFTALCAQVDTLKSAKNKQKVQPLEGIDLTWLNGGDRRATPTLAGKYFTPTVMMDVNCTYSFNNPVDHTVVGSTALARNNEIQVSAAHLGGDFSYEDARAHIVLQFGT